MHRGELADEGEHYKTVSMRLLAEVANVHILNCGVTVVRAVRYERKQNTGNEFVMHSPILSPTVSSVYMLRRLESQHIEPLTKKWP